MAVVYRPFSNLIETSTMSLALSSRARPHAAPVRFALLLFTGVALIDLRVAEAQDAPVQCLADLSIGGSSFKCGPGAEAMRNGTALGIRAEAATRSTAVGLGSSALGDDSVAVGLAASTNGELSVSVGVSTYAEAPVSLALGYLATAVAEGSVALGAFSIANQEDTVSIGRDDDFKRRIVNMADGVGATDGVNVRQMRAENATTLEDAQAYADAGDANTLAAAQIYADAGDADTLATARTYADVGDADTLASAQTYADAGDANTLASAQTYADVGDANTLAMAQTYADAGDSVTLSAAQTYADGAAERAVGFANAYTDQQVALMAGGLERLRERADAGTAAALAGANIPQAFQPGRSTIGAGLGYWRGEGALAIGASHLTRGGRVTIRGSVNLARRGGSGGGVGIGFSF